MEIKAKVVEILPDNKCVAVDENFNSYTAILKGNVKGKKIYVGDYVKIEEKSDVYLINEVVERKNSFIRPPVANIDYMVLCISLKQPSPDFLLLDKQIVLCKKSSITPIICITKSDLIDKESEMLLKYITDTYKKIGLKVILSSAKDDKNLEEKFAFEKGKVYSFSGNSGVGKSSIISRLILDETIETANVARKTERGRHTTKYVKLYKMPSGSFIVDTPGFSSYELFGIESKDLKAYYEEFNSFKCEFLDCTHTKENECNVKKNVASGNIDKGRYDRYIYLYNQLKEKEKFKYKR